jgi:hypothetical protein
MRRATRHPLHPVLMRLLAVLCVAGLLGAGTFAGVAQAACPLASPSSHP